PAHLFGTGGGIRTHLTSGSKPRRQPWAPEWNARSLRTDSNRLSHAYEARSPPWIAAFLLFGAVTGNRTRISNVACSDSALELSPLDALQSRPRDLHPPRSSLPVRCPAFWAWAAREKWPASNSFPLFLVEAGTIRQRDERRRFLRGHLP